MLYFWNRSSCRESFLDARETRRELETASLRVFLWILEGPLTRIYEKLELDVEGGVGPKSLIFLLTNSQGTKKPYVFHKDPHIDRFKSGLWMASR